MAIQVKPKDNILSTYNNYTYNISLYGIPKDDYNKFSKLKTTSEINEYKFSSKYIIFATAKSVINLRTLEIATTPMTSESNVFLGINMELFQTKGMSLYQILTLSSLLGGWENAREQMYVLEISFNGVSEDGAMDVGIAKKRYTLGLNTINSHFDYTGSSYSITAFPRSVTANTSTEALIDYQLVLKGIQTTTDFFNAFETALNDALKKDNKNANIHKFDVDPVFLGKRFKRDADEQSTQRDGNMKSAYSAGESTFTIPKGTTISNAITSAFSLCPEITKLLNKDAIPRITHVISPIVTYGKYVSEMGVYQMEYNWVIKPQTVIVKLENSWNAVERERRIVEGMHGETLNKVYYYTYTGRNTEVVSLDLDTSTFDVTTEQAFKGIFKNPSTNIPGNNTSKPSVDNSTMLTQMNIEESARESIYKSLEPKKDQDNADVYYLEDITNTDFLNNLDYFKTKVVRTTNSSSPSLSGQASDSDKENYDNHIRTIRYSANSLMGATLKIKGDPYWLAQQSMSIEDDESALSYTRYNNVGVFFNYPTYDYTELNNSDNVVTGVYMVTGVTSTFSAGLFEQKLELKRLLSSSGSMKV